MSTGIDPIDSVPLIIRTYNDDSADNTFLLTRYDYPVSSNYVLRTSANGSLAPSDALTQTTMGMSSMTISNHFGSTMIYDTFSSATLFLPVGVFDTIVKTTMLVSSVTASTIYLNTLNICTMNASTFSPNGVTVCYTTLGSTVQTSSMTYSTLVGDSLFTNVGFVSTLFGSSIYAKSAVIANTVNDTSRISTLTVASTAVGFLSFSTLQGNTLTLSTLSGSTIYANSLTVSTLDGESLITSTISCASTLSVSTLYASGLTFSTTTGSSVAMSTATAPLLFSHSLSFSTAQGSTVVVSSVTASSFYTSLLVGSTLQSNTLLFSTLAVSSVNTSVLTYSTTQGSTMIVSTIDVSTLVSGPFSASTLSGSSITASTILLSTLTGSTISWNRVALSTLQGSNAIISSVTVSTLVSGAVSAASLQGSTVLVSTVTGSSLNTNFLSGSTIASDSLFFSTLSVSTLFSDSPVYSTLQGSTTTISSLTVSTLSVSTTLASTLNGSTAAGSTLTTSSIQSDRIVFSTLQGSTLFLSTLTSCTINAQTIRVSTLQGSTVIMSTLTGSTIASDQLIYSTLIGSTIVTDYLTAVSTCTGQGSLLLSTLAFSTQQTSAAFLSTLIVTSTLTVSTLNRINPTSFTASTLTLSGSLQANTASGLLVCSSLTVNAMNLSRSLVNQPVYGNTVKTDSIAASGQSLVQTSGIRATIDQMPNQPQTYTFGPAIPNRWVAAGGTATTLAYSNDGFNWIGLGATILGTGRCAAWNGTMWVAVGDIGSYNSIAYSYDGLRWTGCGTGIFTTYGMGVTWNGIMWVAVGGGTNSIAYSYDGINWTGLGNSIFSTYGHVIVWNGIMFVACGVGTNTIAYSYDGIIWVGLGTSILGTTGLGLAWNGNMWVAGGNGGNSLAYSYDGITWTGLGSISPAIYTVAWNGTIWVAGSDSASNSLLYSYDGLTWTGVGTSIFSQGRAISWNGAMFIAGGGGTNTLSYSYNGINWYGLGTVGLPNITLGCGFNTRRPHRITFPSPMTVATGSGTNTLAYSVDGISWTGNGMGMFSTQGNGVATNGSMWVATGSGTNTLAYSTTGDTPYIHLPFENSTYADVIGNSTVTVYGPPAFVTGTIGSKAVSLSNSGSAATQYIYGTWTGPSNFTVSFWFNMISFILANGQAVLFSAYNGSFLIIIYANSLSVYWGGIKISTSSIPLTNTWYYVTFIHQTNGLCSLYLNNSLVGSYTNSGGMGTSPNFAIGTYDTNTNSPFNGYIDDFRIYNYAVTVNSRMIWRGLGTSVFSDQGKGVAWSGTMWVAVGSGVNSIAYSYDGITWIGLGNSIFTSGNGVAWRGSMWVAVGSGANTIAYSYDGIIWTGLGINIFSIQGNGIAWNDSLWVAVGSGTYSIAYSNDGRIWTGINVNNTSIPVVYLPFENSPIDTFNGLTLLSTIGSITYTSNTLGYKIGYYSAYFSNTAGSTTPSNYLIYATPTSLQNPTALSISFWISPAAVGASLGATPIGFNNTTTQGLFFQYLPTGYFGAYFASTTETSEKVINSLAAISSSTWTHVAFTFSIVNGFGVGMLYLNGVYQGTASTTGIGGLGIIGSGAAMTRINLGCMNASNFAYAGNVDDVRIYTSAITPSFISSLYYSSIPLYLNATLPPFTTSGNSVAWNGTRWSAVGSGGNTIVYSADGITWTPATSSCFTIAGNGISWNGTQWVATGSGTNLIGYSSDGSTWTGGVVHNIISPQLTGLLSNSWTQNNVTWASSISSAFNTSYKAYGAFDNTYVNSWGSATVYNATGDYVPAVNVSTTVTTAPGTTVNVDGEWIQIQSMYPLIMHSYRYACGNSNASHRAFPRTFYIVGSNDGVTWYAIQSCSMIVNPLTATVFSCSSYIIVNQSGIQTIRGGIIGSGAFTTYPPYTTQPYTYFRLISQTLWRYTAGINSSVSVGEWYINFGSPFVSNTFDSSRYSYTYTAYGGATVTASSYKPYTPSITLASGSSQYLQTANFTPTTSGLSFAFWYKSNTSGTWGRIFDFGTGAGSDNILCSPAANDGVGLNRFGFSCYYGSTGSNFYLNDINYNDNTWRHVVWTLSYVAAGSLTSTWNIYINGVFKTTTTSYYPNTAVSRTLSYIGRSNWVSDSYYNGNIDDFRIYNATLTASQAYAIYSGSGYNNMFSTAGSGIASNNTLSGTVVIQHPVVAVGQGTHSLAYSPDGVQWTGLGTALFTTGYCVAWNGSKWIVGGLGANTLAYSYDGVRWTGLGSTVFSVQVNGIAWNGSLWVAVGSGLNTIAYSTDGLSWMGINNTIFTSCNAVAWNGKQWVAVGQGTNSIAYSADGITWTAISNTIFSDKGNGIAWTGSLWVAVGTGTNSIAYSSDGSNWTPSPTGNAIFTDSANSVAWNGTRWVAVGAGASHTIAYSVNGIVWTGFGKTLFPTAGNGICWTGTRFVAVGNGSMIGYSQDGLTWYSAPNSIFTQGNGVAGNPRLGATVSDSQVALSDSLDVVSDTYYNTGYTNFSATIQSQTYAVDKSSVTMVIKTLPGAPTNVSGALYPSGAAIGIRVSFTYPTNTGGGVDAYYASAIDVGGSQPTVTALSPSQPIIIIGLVPGTTYRFEVYSSNFAGQSAATAAASSLFFQVAPSVPQNYSVVLDPPTNPTSIIVSFTAPATSGGITNYTVTPSFGSAQTGTTLSYAFTGLTPGTLYNFSAYGTNTGGTGAIASSSITYYAKPDAPTVSSITLDPPATPTGVHVAFSTNGGTGGGALTYVAIAYDSNLAVVSSTTGSASPLKIIGLTPGVSYTYRVVASNPSVSSIASAAFGPTLYQLAQPDAPNISSVTLDPPSNPTGINVAFTTNGNNGGGTLSYVATAYLSGVATVFTASGSSSPLKITGLSAGTSYTFKVIASNVSASNTSTASSALIYYTKSGPPTGVSAALQPAAAPTGVNVSFAAPANTGGGNLTYVATAYSGATAIASSASGVASPLYVTGLTAGTSYTYRIVATNSAVPAIVSDASTASAAATYYTAPSPPQNPTRTTTVIGFLNFLTTITWEAPAINGGSPIISYTIDWVSWSETVTYNSNTFTASKHGLGDQTIYTTNAAGLSSSVVSFT
jgi:hypothetical protein